jgi:hypothetical protein
MRVDESTPEQQMISSSMGAAGASANGGQAFTGKAYHAANAPQELAAPDAGVGAGETVPTSDAGDSDAARPWWIVGNDAGAPSAPSSSGTGAAPSTSGTGGAQGIPQGSGGTGGIAGGSGGNSAGSTGGTGGTGASDAGPALDTSNGSNCSYHGTVDPTDGRVLVNDAGMYVAIPLCDCRTVSLWSCNVGGVDQYKIRQDVKGLVGVNFWCTDSSCSDGLAANHAYCCGGHP